MTPTKLLIGQFLVVLLILVLGLWAATQWAAHMLAYQPELGPPWFTLRGLPLYRPWALFRWCWTYGEDRLLALRRAGSDGLAATAGIPVESLNFGYAIEGARVAWRPLRAFDDGRQTFIEFPPALRQSEAPPLFVHGADGRAELVNYRVRGRFYVVDRIFGSAELRLGARRQQVVRIVRLGAASARRGRGA